ncbi:type II toxin-antitoxin system VapC family toxin [Oleisolibacter albus]|uniref:type II toxin-antitoxin system VapC family toxin n=1 Tax=Oleisolibacter albus TaxID=2171757 RepID=UPI0019613C80|nr:type II toxin-antitoxin system VapC family toxin [Oleisolibacter albus]
MSLGLLLESHAALWRIAAPDRLSGPARRALAEPRTRLHVSVVTAWELEMKAARGKLPLPPTLWGRMVEAGITFLPVSMAHALLAARLPLHHRDPIDRMIVAQAMTEGLTLVTKDPAAVAYGLPVLW